MFVNLESNGHLGSLKVRQSGYINKNCHIPKTWMKPRCYTHQGWLLCHYTIPEPQHFSYTFLRFCWGRIEGNLSHTKEHCWVQEWVAFRLFISLSQFYLSLKWNLTHLGFENENEFLTSELKDDLVVCCKWKSDWTRAHFIAYTSSIKWNLVSLWKTRVEKVDVGMT